MSDDQVIAKEPAEMFASVNPQTKGFVAKDPDVWLESKSEDAPFSVMLETVRVLDGER
jgi:hypothetical protein